MSWNKQQLHLLNIQVVISVWGRHGVISSLEE